MPNTPTGTLIQNTARQSQAASRPPATRPMNMPASAAIWLVPSAKPRRSGGNASVRIAAELAISIDPPIACRNRQPISHSAPCVPWNGSNDSRIDAIVNTTKPRVVHLHPAEHVAQLPEVDHEHRLDQAVAHDHPQQVADVARRQRVEVDAAEDRRQRDDDDRAVERGHEDGRGRVGQGDPGVPIRLGRDRPRLVAEVLAPIRASPPAARAAATTVSSWPSSSSLNPSRSAAAICSVRAPRLSCITCAARLGDRQHDPPAVLGVPVARSIRPRVLQGRDA